MRALATWLPDPVAERQRTGARFGTRDQRLVVQLRAEVAGVRIRYDLTRIFLGAEELARQFVERDGFGTSNFNCVIERRPEHNVAEHCDNFVREDRLHQRRRQAIDFAVERRPSRSVR